MLLLILASVVLIAGGGGWVCGRVRKGMPWLMALLVLPVVLYAAIGVWDAVVSDESVGVTFAWWMIGFGYVGLPMLVWAALAAVGFRAGRIGKQR